MKRKGGLGKRGKVIPLICALACTVLFAFGSGAQVNFKDTVLSRYTRFLLEQFVPDSAQIVSSLKKLQPNGRWNDVDYNDKSIGNWQLRTALERMVVLAKAYNKKGSSFYHSNAVKEAIDRTLKDWTTNRYKNPNWWYNDILTPQCFRDIVVLQIDFLTPEQRVVAFQVIAQHRVGGTGANLTWTADIGLHDGALTGNDSLMRACAGLLAGEIKQNGEEGIQPDYSFRQHGARLQTYHYGNAFTADNVRLAWELRATPWAYPDGAVALLTHFILNGYWWMARGIHTVPSTIDRAVSRPAMLAVADLRSLVPYLKQLSPQNSRYFDSLYAWESGDYSLLEGFRYYPYSDFSVYHTKDFSFFIKTVSTRTLPTESINNENLKGSGLNNGNTWILSQGAEYDNLMPLWDWAHLPGSTVAKTGLKIWRQAYSGGTGDGESGITAMTYAWGNADTGLTAKKTWITHNGVAICLTAGINVTGSDAPVWTTLEQCRLRGSVAINDPSKLYTTGLNFVRDVKWIHHAGLLYMPLNNAAINVQIDPREGAWADVNKNQSADKIRDTVFMPVWLHKPNETAIGYAVTACANAKDAPQKAAKKSWRVLINSEACQAVVFTDGTLMLACFDTAKQATALPVKVNRPCLLVLKRNIFFVADPLHKGGNLVLEYKSKGFETELPVDGSTVRLTMK